MKIQFICTLLVCLTFFIGRKRNFFLSLLCWMDPEPRRIPSCLPMPGWLWATLGNAVHLRDQGLTSATCSSKLRRWAQSDVCFVRLGSVVQWKVLNSPNVPILREWRDRQTQSLVENRRSVFKELFPEADQGNGRLCWRSRAGPARLAQSPAPVGRGCGTSRRSGTCLLPVCLGCSAEKSLPDVCSPSCEGRSVFCWEGIQP